MFEFLDHEHVRRVDGRWVFPALAAGVVGIRECADGTWQAVWTCSNCEYRTSAIAHYELERRGMAIRDLPVVESYLGQFGRCVVKGCESVDVQLNHFGPRAIFRDDADRWPTGYLCREHHREWGERVTPHLNPPRRQSDAA